jgi:ParB-like chromosome segregation protein Spo0J
MTYPIHPLAELFPSIDGAEFYALVASIKAGGLRDAITIHEGAVIDGRNRQRACEAAGVDARYEPLPSDADPLQFVLDRNLTRRHLTESQRAMVAAKIANMKQGNNSNAQICATSQNVAADRLNVSRRSVQSATKVRDGGVIELQRAVERGDVAVSAAAAVSELDDDEQRKVVALGSKEVRARAKDVREKKTKKRRPRGSTVRYQPEDRHDTDLHRLEAAWEVACDNARASFLESVRSEPARGTAAICERIREAILILSRQPTAHEVVGWFVGTDGASIISEHLRPAAAWLAEFSDAWKDDQ